LPEVQNTDRICTVDAKNDFATWLWEEAQRKEDQRTLELIILPSFSLPKNTKPFYSQ
jgi:hypothetical protein